MIILQVSITEFPINAKSGVWQMCMYPLQYFLLGPILVYDDFTYVYCRISCKCPIWCMKHFPYVYCRFSYHLVHGTFCICLLQDFILLSNLVYDNIAYAYCRITYYGQIWCMAISYTSIAGFPDTAHSGVWQLTHIHCRCFPVIWCITIFAYVHCRTSFIAYSCVWDFYIRQLQNLLFLPILAYCHLIYVPCRILSILVLVYVSLTHVYYRMSYCCPIVMYDTFTYVHCRISYHCTFWSAY